MKPLIDGDVILHEIGWSGQFKDLETGEDVLLPFETVTDILNGRIRQICEGCGGTEEPLLFFSNSDWVSREINIRAKYCGGEPIDSEKNFRYARATSQPYKGTRKNPKPYHFYNIWLYLLDNYAYLISQNGLEADDEMCIYQTASENTIICSRDKDLRICPGWHYSWKVNGQMEFPPTYTDELGWININKKKVSGYGKMFFYAQMIMGDGADNIPGLPGAGPVKAWETLSGLDSEMKCYKAVRDLYKSKGYSKEYFIEQADLLWMIQERGVGYAIPKEERPVGNI